MKKVVNCKERFGYAYVWITDRKISNIFGGILRGTFLHLANVSRMAKNHKRRKRILLASKIKN